MNLAIIQARLASTRLPAKIMLEVCGKTLLEHMIERVKHSKKIDEIVIATTDNKLDDIIVEWCKKHKIKFFRGPELDVLKRFKLTNDIYDADTIVRICSDNPLIDPKTIDEILEIYKSNNYDFVSNLFPLEGRTFPDGTSIEVFSSKLLLEADLKAKKPSEREHVTFYFWMQPERFKIFRYDYPKNYSKFRFNLDYVEDYCLIRSVFESLYSKNKIFSMEDVILWLEHNPKILKFNEKIKTAEGWKKSFDEDKRVGF